MKRRLFALTAVVALSAASAVPAFAHEFPEPPTLKAQLCDPGIVTVLAVVEETAIPHVAEVAPEVVGHLLAHIAALCPDIPLPG